MIVKSRTATVAIGSKSSVSRKGSILEIGSALGSCFAQILRTSIGQRDAKLDPAVGKAKAIEANRCLIEGLI
uniref:Uncharacterized protein n=1 Tax=Rhizobium rhizogenes TaxID=359 RepID=A0A7S5DS27_RHIRH|nr:hypothetical protein [Rhizobium rhizogenes]QCL10030.1 hypothetical protein pC5.8d_727 [Rhizobium rhizogenes]